MSVGGPIKLRLPAGVQIEVSGLPRPGLTSRQRAVLHGFRSVLPLGLGLLALGIAAHAQRVITLDHDSARGLQLYLLSIIVIVAAWWRSSANRTCLVVPAAPPAPSRATLLSDWFQRSARPPLREFLASFSAPPIFPSAPLDASGLRTRARRLFGSLRSGIGWLIAAIYGPEYGWSTARTGGYIQGRLDVWAARASSVPTRQDRILDAVEAALRLPPRYLVAIGAVVLSLVGVAILRGTDYRSAVGGLLWFVGLLLLPAAFVREPARPVRPLDGPADDPETHTDWRLPRAVEVGLVAAIMAITVVMRFYRIDDWSTGIHGDEAEMGLLGIRIFSGELVSPYDVQFPITTVPNAHGWAVALMMAIFGPGLVGVRMFSVLAGTVMLIPFYLLVRMWFGTRTAVIASILLAVSPYAIHETRQAFGIIMIPFSLVTGIYLFFYAIRTNRTLVFILSAYVLILSMYFYVAARINYVVIGIIVAYLVIIVPLLQPSAETVGRAIGRQPRAWLEAVIAIARARLPTTSHYLAGLAVFVGACLAMSAPSLAYLLDRPADANARINAVLIFRNEHNIPPWYEARHEPVYLSLRMPNATDLFSLSPVALETGPLSLKILDDGYWPRVLVRQLTTTLAVLTHRPDGSSFFPFNQPIVRPVEAILIILGVAWAASRWRDARMVTLSVWFWATVVFLGVLSAGAPNILRLLGLLPTLAIFPAIVLSKLIGEAIQLATRLGPHPGISRRVTQVAFAAGVGVFLIWLGQENFTQYYVRYLSTYPFAGGMSGPAFVHQMNEVYGRQNRPPPIYLDMANPVTGWDGPSFRFPTHGTLGRELFNLADELPVLHNGDRDVVFMIWRWNREYTPMVPFYYPEAEVGEYHYGRDGIVGLSMTYYRLTREQIEARRVSNAVYTAADGTTLERKEAGVGTSDPLPSSLSYPVTARWTANILIPRFGEYTFRVSSPTASALEINGRSVLTTTPSHPRDEARLILAKGLQRIQVQGTVLDGSGPVTVEWAPEQSEFGPISHRLLWDGPGRALFGIMTPSPGNVPFDSPRIQPDSLAIVAARLDGFLGVRHLPGLARSDPTLGIWRGTLSISERGSYDFEMVSRGGSALLLGERPVLRNDASGDSRMVSQATLLLEPGIYNYEVRYQWQGQGGQLEVFWTPPGGTKAVLAPDQLVTEGGLVGVRQ